MKGKINLLFLSIILVFVSGCSNKSTHYLKDGEAILNVKNAGKDRLHIAADFFKKELKIHPNSTRAQMDLAVAYGNLNWHDQSISFLTHLIEQRQNDLSKFYRLRGLQKYIKILQFHVKNEFESAIKDFDFAIKLDSTNTENYRDLVLSLVAYKYFKMDKNGFGKWQKFDEKEIKDIIKSVYPKGSKLPSVKEFWNN